jgi:hypothetical protein
MSMRPHGRAVIDPDAPEATALCDRCKKLYNRGDLSYQFDWVGQKYQNKRLLVCGPCMDEPSDYLRSLTIPADPTPVVDGRVLGTPIDFKSSYTLSKLVGTPSMFSSVSAMSAETLRVHQGSPAISGVSAVAASVRFGATFRPAFSGSSSAVAHAAFGAVVAPAISGASALSGVLAYTAQPAPHFSASSSVIAYFVVILEPALASVASLTAGVIFGATQAASITGVSAVSAALLQTKPDSSLLGGSPLGVDALGGGGSIFI